ncbi:MAG TPA: riboflavin synthase [Allosphingosinicella sp.]|nr:riboflavin synthase [Allosphingosinicella sp.]
MFTGIITDVGQVRAIEQRGDMRLTIATSFDMTNVDLGASIACSGVCLTVVDKGPGWFAVDVSAETLSRTAPGIWKEGAALNLERALRLGDELGGHIVTGHIDGVGEVESVADIGGSTRVTIIAPQAVEAYIATKGSVALDGVSLTVNDVEPISEGVRFAVNIIPHTAAQTSFADLAAGRKINIEIDVLARYIGRMMELRR